jgi:hypothetical protein
MDSSKTHQQTKQGFSLLRRIAVPPSGGVQPLMRYDASRQISQIWENSEWVDSWKAQSLAGSKKRDIETGEDNKGE